MAQDLILALDQGTTSTRAIAFTAPDLAVCATARRDLAQHFPASGWVEHDAQEIYDHSTAVLREALAAAGGDVSRVAAVGITNQRETTVIWRRDTGQPIHNAIVEAKLTTGNEFILRKTAVQNGKKLTPQISIEFVERLPVPASTRAAQGAVPAVAGDNLKAIMLQCVKGAADIVRDSGVQLGNDELQRLAVTLFITRSKAA